MVILALPSPASIRKKVLTALVFLHLFFAFAVRAENIGPNTVHSTVRRVIDGDTIVMENGESVRYAGIDTPEEDEIFYKEAKERNRALVRGKRVAVVLCGERPRDDYGRILAWVYADGVDVSGVLLEEGLARVLKIPPCGLKKSKEYDSLQRGARFRRRGIWGAGRRRGD